VLRAGGKAAPPSAVPLARPSGEIPASVGASHYVLGVERPPEARCAYFRLAADHQKLHDCCDEYREE